MSAKTPEQIDAEIARLQEQREQAEKARREKVRKAIGRAAERAGLLNQSWTAKDLEAAFRTLARHGTAAIRPPESAESESTEQPAEPAQAGETADESGGEQAEQRRGFGAFGGASN